MIPPISQPVRIACHGRNGHQIHRTVSAGHPGAVLTAISGFDDSAIPGNVLRFDTLAGLLAARRKKKIFPTREAYRTWLESREALERELRAHVARIDSELAGRKK